VPTDASLAPELLVLVLDEPPELLPDPLPPLDPDALVPPELPALEVLPDALPEPLPDELEPPEVASDPFDVLASPVSGVQDEEVVPQADEHATTSTRERRSLGRTAAS
jgi:hypothetical protein